MANDALNRYIEAAAGITQLTKTRAQQIVKQLMQQTEIVSGPATELVDDLVDRSRQNREAIAAIVRAETNRAIKAMGLATRSEVDRLQRQVTELRRAASSGSASSTSSGAKKSTSGGRKKSTSTTTKKTSSGTKKASSTGAKKTSSSRAKKSGSSTAKKSGTSRS